MKWLKGFLPLVLAVSTIPMYVQSVATAQPLAFDDPSSVAAQNVLGSITLDGLLSESDWSGAQTLLFGNGAEVKQQPGEFTVTAGFDIKATYDYWDQGVFYGTFHLPNTDSSLAKVKFLRRGTNLYVGIQSDDKSICKFDWEGDGIFMKVKKSDGTDVEYKLYYQNLNDTIRYEENLASSGAGAGSLTAGSTVNDTTQVDNGYTAEMVIHLDSLGYAPDVTGVEVTMAVFDPDGYQHPMNSYDTTAGTYYKSWWGSEWGGVYRTVTLSPEPVRFDDPATLAASYALDQITLDGKLDERDWGNTPVLLYGNGAFLKRQGEEKTVTGGFDIKATYDYWDQGIFYGTFHLPNTDSSLAKVRFLRRGMDLYVGIQSDDKSICKFDWEGDGIFMKVKKSDGTDVEYKLYYQNLNDTIRYEENLASSGAGAGSLAAGSTVNDTTQVDNGYTAEMVIHLDSLGYAPDVTGVEVTMAVFDPDGYQHPMNSYDTTAGTYYKSWWGSEWGGVYRTVTLSPEPVRFDDPAAVTVKNAYGPITLDGKLDEGVWTGAPTLLYGNGAFLRRQGEEKTVTAGFDIKATYDYWDQGIFYGTFHLPNTDSSLAKVKFLRRGTNLYVGIQSDDKSICKFDWEGDGIFMKVKKSDGTDVEYKLYYQNLNDTIRYEENLASSGAGAGSLAAGSTVNDTTQVDNGYTAELMIDLAALGYAPDVTGVEVTMAVFDPDGYQHPMNSYDTTAGTYYKSWWGSEWGGVYRTLELTPELTVFDDPDTMLAKAATGGVTLDGMLTEPEWATAPVLLYGNGAFLKRQGEEKTVTGAFDIKATYDYWDQGILYGTFHLPNTDSSLAKVKFLHRGTTLYVGIQSDDKSICKFDWEGDGIFMKVKQSDGTDVEYKLYYQNLNDTIRYEEQLGGSGFGAGSVASGSKVNDTTQVDNGYTAELMIDLAALGHAPNVSDVQLMMVVFDPDGYQHPMNSYDTTAGSYYKSWWGSEWGGAYGVVHLEGTVGVAEGTGVVPASFRLAQNYPNPFNPSTRINYDVAERSNITIALYDVLGRMVRVLATGDHAPGSYAVTLDASGLASGVYLYRMTSATLDGSTDLFTSVKSLVLLK